MPSVSESQPRVDPTASATTKETAAPVDSLPDPCGLYDDGAVWTPRKVPERKKTSDATAPAERRKYQAMLDKIFSKESIIGQRVDFDPNDVMEVLRGVWPYLKSEPMFIEDIDPPIVVIADLHGQLFDLNRIFMCRSYDNKPGYLCDKYIFLGDYVDRGRQSLEIVMAVFCLKILYPDNFFLLRGNHEFMSINLNNGFADELIERFERTAAEKVYSMTNAVFSWLSVCAIVGGKAFCVHGGVSQTGFNKTELRNLRKPCLSNKDNNLVHDLVWSDPADGLQGTCFNMGRHASFYYGEDVFAQAMYKIDCLYMVRGHSRIVDGCEVTFGRCFTFFSCSCMNLKRNSASYGVIDKDMKLAVVVLAVDEDRFKIEKEIRKIENRENEEADVVTVAEKELGDGKIATIKG